MKKTLCLATLLCLLAVCCLGCAQAKPQNYIEPKQLTPEQQELMFLLGHQDTAYLLFEYQTKELYQYVDFWVEIYKDGELIEERAAEFPMIGDEPHRQAGTLAVVISATPDFQWLFAYRGDSYTMTGGPSEPNTNYLPHAWSRMGLSGPIAIEADKEIVLHVSHFSESNPYMRVDLQAYVDEPEILKDYTYVHLIKCKFSNTEEPK